MRPPLLSSLLAELQASGRLTELLVRPIGPVQEGGWYRHWDTLRHLAPPEDLTHREWWALVKLARRSMKREITLEDRAGRSFSYTLPDPMLGCLHHIDCNASGQISLPEEAVSPEQRDRYVFRSLIEEAVTSSQLEGATTTRRVAKEMLRTGRDPTSKDERMILNNFEAMRWVRDHRDEPLTPAFVGKLHGVVTEGTLPAADVGTLRTPKKGTAPLGVYDGNQLVHRPPDAAELPERLEKLCAFANETPTGVFLHPALKAIILHFWLAYDHPFEDGNGRTARALFYWFMLREGFWLFEYVSISTILKKGPARYARSFLYTETDDNDLTYFLLFQLDVVERALDALRSYLQKKTQEMKEMRALLRPSANLNHRQIALLGHALRHPGQRYTFAPHRRSHDVAYQTARTDLLGLSEKELLRKGRDGRTYVFTPAPDLAERIQQLS
jgi:Fic family protein